MAVCTICQRNHATVNHARLVRRGSIRAPSLPGAPSLPREEAGAPAPSGIGGILDSAGIIQAINNLAGLLAPTDSHVITFSRSIPAATADTETQRIPFDASIIATFMHFPPGTNQLVEVRLTAMISGALYYILPSKQDAYIALDDSFIPFTGLLFTVPRGSVLQAEWYNYDGGNPHTVPITVVIAVAGRAGGVALPISEFVPAPEMPREPPTVAPEPPAAPVRPPALPTVPEPPPIFPFPVPPAPVPPTVYPPTARPPTAPPSVSRMDVSVSPRTTRANPGTSQEIALGFASDLPNISGAGDISVPVVANAILMARGNTFTQDYGKVFFNLIPGQTTNIRLRITAPERAGVYDLRVIAGLQNRFNENIPGSWLLDRTLSGILEVLALPVAPKPTLTIRRPTATPNEAFPGDSVNISVPYEATGNVPVPSIPGANIALVLDNTAVDSQQVDLTAIPGSPMTRTVTLRVPFNARPGNYGVQVRHNSTVLPGASFSNVLRVWEALKGELPLPPITPPTPSIQPGDLSVSGAVPAQGRIGDQIPIAWELRNRGVGGGPVTVETHFLGPTAQTLSVRSVVVIPKGTVRYSWNAVLFGIAYPPGNYMVFVRVLSDTAAVLLEKEIGNITLGLRS